MSLQSIAVRNLGAHVPNSVWVVRACAAAFLFAAILYCSNFPGAVAGFYRSVATPSLRQSMQPAHYLAFGAGSVFSLTLLVASLRLFLLRRWASITLAVMGWTAVFFMTRTVPLYGVDLVLVLTLAVMVALTASMVQHWQQFKSGF
jgi:hypothetical protein